VRGYRREFDPNSAENAALPPESIVRLIEIMIRHDPRPCLGQPVYTRANGCHGVGGGALHGDQDDGAIFSQDGATQAKLRHYRPFNHTRKRPPHSGLVQVASRGVGSPHQTSKIVRLASVAQTCCQSQSNRNSLLQLESLGLATCSQSCVKV
jgi:hypothetical protein